MLAKLENVQGFGLGRHVKFWHSLLIAEGTTAFVTLSTARVLHFTLIESLEEAFAIRQAHKVLRNPKPLFQGASVARRYL